jgi:hypothetical protein
MFKKRKQRQAQEASRRALAEWQAAVEEQRGLIEAAEALPVGGNGNPGNVLLGKDEGIYLTVERSILAEERSSGGHWEGRSQGFSVPIGSIGGHSVRYRVGASRGHFVKDPPQLKAIDEGVVTITSNRLVFTGGKQTREAHFSKLIGFQYMPDGDGVVLNVSNRQKPISVHFGRGPGETVRFRLELALATFRGEKAEFIAGLRRDLSELEAARPSQPQLPASAGTSSVPPWPSPG